MPDCPNCAKLKAQRDSLASERDDILLKLQAEREGAIRYYRDRDALLMASGKNYWLWQGDGGDHLESLVCPVLIQAKQLQAIVAERDSLAGRLKAAEAALAKVNEERPYWLWRTLLEEVKGPCLDVEIHDATETCDELGGACITEWCPPCAAAKFLDDIRKAEAPAPPSAPASKVSGE